MINESKGRLSEEEAIEEAAKLKGEKNKFPFPNYDTAEKIVEAEKNIENQTEILKDLLPEVKQEEISAKVSEEFKKYTEKAYEQIEQRFSNEDEDGDGERLKASMKKDFAYCNDVYKQVSEITNNFHCWFDGGINRNLLEERKKSGEDTSSDEKLVVDLDNIINKGGYKSIDFNSQPNDFISKAKLHELWNLRQLAKADIFFKMCDNGYDPKKLWK